MQRRDIFQLLLLLLCGTPLLWASGMSETGMGILIDSFDQWSTQELVVNASYFDVEYSGVPGDVLHAEIYGPSDQKVERSRSGDTVSIDVKEPLLGVSGNPAGLIRISGPLSMQNIQIVSESGHVRISKVTAGTLSVTSTSGSVVMEDCQGPAHVVTTSANVNLTGCDGAKEIQTTSGDVQIEASPGSVTAQSTSGRIKLWVVDGTVELRSVSGAIEGTRLNLSDNSTFRTTSGRIEIMAENNPAELTYDLQTQSGSIAVDSTDAGREVTQGSGPISVTARSHSGDIAIYHDNDSQ